MDMSNYLLIMTASLLAAASPGPATLGIASCSMRAGRKTAMVMALGISTGSLCWAISAALGLGALMKANIWLFEMVRYIGACYLIFLALKSAKSVLRHKIITETKGMELTLGQAYRKGLALHLTNPKAVLFFASLFSIGMPEEPSLDLLAIIILSVCGQGFLIFQTYAILFSSKPMVAGYNKLKRWFEAFFALAFGAAGIKILLMRLS